MHRILVAYYSRTGYTGRVAELLAKRLGASLLHIEESRSRAGALGYLRAGWDALRGHDADIRAPTFDPGDFDLVLLGTPVWAGHASPPVRTFARRHRGDLRAVGLFCTLGGSGEATALAELQQDLHRQPLATLALTDSEIDGGVIDFKLAGFAAALRAGLPVQAQAEAA